MKDFRIFKLNEYESYVLLVSNEDIYFLYDKLKKELNNQKIIIDLFYRNGFSFNRFIEIDFNKPQNQKSRIINPRFVSESIKNNTKRKSIKKCDFIFVALKSKKFIFIMKFWH